MNLGNRLDRNRPAHLQDIGSARDTRDRRNVADDIEIELVVERGIDRGRRPEENERIAVRSRMYCRLGTDVGGGTRPVVEDDGPAQPLRQPLPHQAREDVGHIAGRHRHDPAHSPRRIGLRPSRARNGRESGSARRQMQEFSACKFHGVSHRYVGHKISRLILLQLVSYQLPALDPCS
jgi:hypothetical protein